MLRDEAPDDAAAIAALLTAAFRDAPRSDGSEAAIVARLRAAGALTLSLVAADAAGLAGHVAFSPVRAGDAPGWQGLAPLAVRADARRRGIGAALVRAGLARLRGLGAAGCVVLGDPAYYGRFGFAADPRLTLAGVPAPHFQILRLVGPMPTGRAEYHPAVTQS